MDTSIILILVFFASLCTILIGYMVYTMQSNGTQATVTVLADGTSCMFEYNGERHFTDIGHGYCYYTKGENMTVYQTNGGQWATQK